MMNSKEGTLQMTRQIIDLLDKIEESDYSKSVTIFSGSSLGDHFRHILDFYNCLIKGQTESFIDYSCRERNASVETQPLVAKRAFEAVNTALEKLDEDQPIQIRSDFSGDIRPVVNSSIGRELMFAFDHALHHLAIIKMGLMASFPHIKVDENMGVSPSTLKKQNGEQAQDR